MVQPPEYRTPIQSPRELRGPPPAPRKPAVPDVYFKARSFELETQWPDADIRDINRIVAEEIQDIQNHHPTPNALLQHLIKVLKNEGF